PFLSYSNTLLLLAVLLLAVLLAFTYFASAGSYFQDPLFCVFVLFSFVSAIDLIISLEEDGFISGFAEVYVREGEPYLRTAHGIMICYWDGIVHYGLYLAMITAMSQRKSYRSLGLFWLGSLVMSILVFLLGNLIGKYSSDINAAFLLNLPYVLIPVWAGRRLFQQPRAVPCLTAEQTEREQRRWLHQRPHDLVLVLVLLLMASFTFFRGMVVLDCPADSCFEYIYQHEPYLRDPVAYPKVQMLIYLFYVLPFLCLCIYALLRPGCSWLPDWSLVFAGAIAQAQFSHLGSSLHSRTPFPYQTPEDVWWSFLITNVFYALGPQLLALRCLHSPAFFLPVTSSSLQGGKKHQ
ncbi:transmembrane 6 superfamily member 2, partial [Meleagris gallopavo]|uniref:transmembrane 6 superfamily member 2 n=1 Tax=Meleagris gallopavo TaxID=9103 RepID=UPI0005499970